MVIPNKEVQFNWVSWFRVFPNNDRKISSLLDLLLAGNIQELSAIFPEIILDSLSYFDVGGSNSGKNAESFYHAYSLGLLVSAKERGFNVKPHREAGTGRYDVIIIPETTAKHLCIAVIIEFKVLYKGRDLTQASEQALWQIEDKKYRYAIPQHIQELVEVGIAFAGKTSYVKGKVLQRDGIEWVV